MTTQEAKLKNDIPRKEEHNKYSELYFPDLRGTLFSIFSGDTTVIEDIVKLSTPGIENLHQDYTAFKQEKGVSNDLPLQIDFTDNGFEINVINREEDAGQPRISIVQIACLDWVNDAETLTILARAVNETVLKCTRLIPKLVNNRAVFKNINQIESNPVYDTMVLVFAMYKMLKMEESLPGCYVQALMARRRVTYNMLCHTLKYCTELPIPIREWFKRDDIVRKQETFAARKQTIQNQTMQQDTPNSKDAPNTDDSHPIEQDMPWALHLVDYTGQKFSQRLSYSFGPKREYVNDRFITIDGDLSITG